MRGRKAPKRQINPDIKMNSVKVEKFINNLMVGGKKSIARKVFYSSIDQVAGEVKKDALDVFLKIMDNVSPTIEVRSRRVGGANYQIPVPVSSQRAEALAIRWIIQSARSKKGMPMNERLKNEFLDAYNNTGLAIKKKTDVEKMAESNRAFSHLA
ncbi:MAG: 30S ribosomal protein S7 [Patescibacteria group bacterium]